MTKIIDCYDSQGKKKCELYPDELTAEELLLTLELQTYQGRVCPTKKEAQKNEKYSVILQRGFLADLKISARTKREAERLIRVAESNGITAKLEVKP